MQHPAGLSLKTELYGRAGSPVLEVSLPGFSEFRSMGYLLKSHSRQFIYNLLQCTCDLNPSCWALQRRQPIVQFPPSCR